MRSLPGLATSRTHRQRMVPTTLAVQMDMFNVDFAGHPGERTARYADFVFTQMESLRFYPSKEQPAQK